MTQTSRQPKGVPVGGQFSASPHDESKVGLVDDAAGLEEQAVESDTPFEDQAFLPANVNAWNTLDDAPGEFVADPTTLKPGTVVAVRGHGKIRSAVVTSVGKKNAQAVFTTPSAYKEAERLSALYVDRHVHIDAMAEEAAEAARRDWDYYQSRTNLNDPSYTRHGAPRPGEAERGVAEAKERLASCGAREDSAARLAQYRRDDIEKNYQRTLTEGLQAFTTFTNATVKPGQAKLIPTPKET